MNVSAPLRRETGASAALIVAMVALATDMFVYGLAIPVLPAIAAGEGAPGLTVGLLFACYAAAFILVTPLVGAWLDRAGPRLPMLIGLGGLGAATLLFAFGHGLGFLMAARLLQGAAAGTSWTASLALIAATHRPETRGRAMGTALSAIAVGTLAGPPVGGFLFQHWGQQAPFLVAAALALVDGAARFALVGDERPEAGSSRAARSWRHPDTPLLFVLTMLGAATIAFLEPVLPLHAISAIRMDPGQVGLTFGLAALVGGAVSPVAGAVTARVPALLIAGGGLALGAAGMALIGLAANPWTIGGALVLVACASAMVLAPTLSLVASVAEARRPPAYGASYAVYNLAYATGLTAGPVLAGAGTTALGFGGATRVAGVLLLLCAGAAIVRWSGTRRGTRER